MTLICLITNEAFHSVADYFITLQILTMVKGTRFSSFSSIKERWIAKKKSSIFLLQLLSHTTYSWNIKWKKCAGISVLWVLNEIFQKNILKIWKKSWEPFRSYLLNSTANPAHFYPNWAGLVVLFSRQLLNGSHDFFCFNILILFFFFKYKISRHFSP